MIWWAIATLALAAAGIGWGMYSDITKTNMQEQHANEQLKIQAHEEKDRIQQEAYQVDADISTIEDKVVDAVTNMSTVANNIEIAKRNEARDVMRLLLKGTQLEGNIYTGSFAGGFLMSETQKKVIESNWENIYVDIDTVRKNAESLIADYKTQFGTYESLAEKYLGKDYFKNLFDFNNDNQITYIDFANREIDVSSIDFSKAGGYLSELYDRLSQLNDQLGPVSNIKNGVTAVVDVGDEHVKPGTRIHFPGKDSKGRQPKALSFV